MVFFSLLGCVRGGVVVEWREAAQNQLDDAFGETLVDRPAGYQQPIEDRSAQDVEGELDI